MNTDSHLCPCCGCRGILLYDAVEDYYFGYAGHWDLLQCNNPSCGVVWPNPFLDDINLAESYSIYYTHSTRNERRTTQSIRVLLARGIYKLIGSQPKGIFLIPIIGQLLEDCFWASGGLKPSPSGKVLDIGCGSGDRLEFLANLGWGKAIGVEPDINALKVGENLGREIHFGTANQLPFESNIFDAAVMHHVIEHVRNPFIALTEVFRILKPETGQLAILTPNVQSKMRKIWGKHWRGFEVPRHLTIFTLDAICNLLRKSGFEIIYAGTSARSSAWIDRVSSEASGLTLSPHSSTLIRLIERDRQYRKIQRDIDHGSNSGEELVVIARKPLANADPNVKI